MGKSIVIITKESRIIHGAQRIFSPQGYAVSVAQEGWDGFVQIQLSRPVLVILDFRIGGLPAHELIHMLYTNPEFDGINLVGIVSWNHYKFWTMKLMHYPFNGLISHPISLGKIDDIISQVIGNPNTTIESLYRKHYNKNGSYSEKTPQIVRKQPKSDMASKNIKYGDILDSKSKEVAIDEAAPGVKIAEAILHPITKAKIIPQGALLTDSLLQKVKSIGVKKIRISLSENSSMESENVA